MTVVVVGPQSLDELEAWVGTRFGKIPDRWSSGDGGAEVFGRSHIVNHARKLIVMESFAK